MQRRLPTEVTSHVPPWLADLLFAVVVAVALVAIRAVEIHSRHLHDARLDGVAIAVVSALTLAVRRRWPIAVWALTLAAVPAVIALDPATGALSAPVLVSVYTAATLLDRRRAIVLAAASAVTLALSRGLIQFKGWSDARTAAEPALVIAALFLGWAVSGRRAYIAEIKHRAAQAEASREEELRHSLDAERLRIARELHDVVAHSIATINVQAGVAAHVIDKNPAHAAEALATIKAASKEALRELRNIVGILRQPDESESRAPAPGLAQLDGLVSTARDAGLPVDVQISGDLRMLPPTLDLAAYRIVQESLTNVLRHAGHARAAVRIGYADEQLVIEVADSGRGATNGRGHSGHGIAGMKERAQAFGGELEAGPNDQGGFRVRAQLPLPTSP
ncbi:MAG: histidine kinase [Solirubrobacteraceae bacterium]|jgi:signal transduction histidine kinase